MPHETVECRSYNTFVSVTQDRNINYMPRLRTTWKNKTNFSKIVLPIFPTLMGTSVTPKVLEQSVQNLYGSYRLSFT